MIRHTASGKWEVSIKYKYKKIHLGTFGSITEATQAYEDKRAEIKGPRVPTGFKRCLGCHEVKPRSSFYMMKSYIAPRCKECFGEDSRYVHIRRKYGITREEFLTMICAQSGQCCICWKELLPGDACVDHDHNTGAARGILCNNCNSGIGHMKDNIESLERAITYLKTGGSYAAIQRSSDRYQPLTS